MYFRQITDALVVLMSLILTLSPFFMLGLIFLIPFCPDSACDSGTSGERYWKRFPYALLQVLAIAGVFFVVSMTVVITQMKGYLSDHFEEYKCSPWFMPFVSWVRPDVSTTANFKQCLGNVGMVVQGAIMSPMMDIATDLSGGQNIQADNLDKIHSHLSRKTVGNAKLFHSLNNQVGAFQAIGNVLFKKIGAIFNNLTALVFDLYYSLQATANMMEVMIFAPQMLLVVLIVFGAFTYASGVGMIAYGTFQTTTGVELEIAGAGEEAIPFMEAVGLAMEATGTIENVNGLGAVASGTSTVIFATIILILFGGIQGILRLATDQNNDLISTQIKMLDRMHNATVG